MQMTYATNTANSCSKRGSQSTVCEDRRDGCRWKAVESSEARLHHNKLARWLQVKSSRMQRCVRDLIATKPIENIHSDATDENRNASETTSA